MIPNDNFRYAVFESNLAKIREHNSRPGETWRMAVTQFADMTEAEFRSEVVGRGYIRTPAPASAPAPSSLGSLNTRTLLKRPHLQATTKMMMKMIRPTTAATMP